MRGDNEKPKNKFENDEQYVLISRHFFYFGRNAIKIPAKYRDDFVKRGPGFRYPAEGADITRFLSWVEEHERGMLGEPCGKDWLARREPERCK